METELEFMENSIKEMTLIAWSRHFEEAGIEISESALELAVKIHFEEMCQYAAEFEQGYDHGQLN